MTGEVIMVATQIIQNHFPLQTGYFINSDASSKSFYMWPKNYLKWTMSCIYVLKPKLHNSHLCSPSNFSCCTWIVLYHLMNGIIIISNYIYFQTIFYLSMQSTMMYDWVLPHTIWIANLPQPIQFSRNQSLHIALLCHEFHHSDLHFIVRTSHYDS